MARFLNPTDYTATIKAETLDELTGGRTTAIPTAEDMAIGQLQSYLGGRYDIASILQKTGADRDTFIVMILIDLALYHLYTAAAPHQIPEHRKVRYDDVIQWLKDVGRGDIQTTLPPLPPDTTSASTTDALRISSEPRQHHTY